MRVSTLLLWVFVILLGGCAGGPPKRVFPPELSLQELQLESSQRWVAKLRVRSFSTVPMTLGSIEGSLSLGGEAITIALQPGIAVAAGSVELIDLPFTPSAAHVAAVQAAMASRGSVRYQLLGELRSSEPRGRFDFDYGSALSPVPGLADVLR